MRARAHLWAGLATGSPMALLGQETFPVLTAAMLGGLLTDLDHPGSTISRILRPVGLIWWPVQQSEFENGRSLIGLHTTWHREGFHSIAAGAIIALVLLAPAVVFVGIRAAGPPVGAFLLAWLSHLAADETNPSGCMLFWPFSCRQVRWRFSVREASWRGRAVEVVASAFAATFLVVMLTLVGLQQLARRP